MATKEIPAITEGVFNNGLILVYLKVPVGLTTTPTQWAAVPFELLSFNGDYMINIAAVYDIGKLRMYYFYELVNQSATLPNVYNVTVSKYYFKYVIISRFAGARMQALNIDFGDYEQVKDYFGLQD